MQGGGDKFYAKLSLLFKKIYSIKNAGSVRKFFCLQEIGSYREFIDMNIRQPQGRPVRVCAPNLILYAASSEEQEEYNRFNKASLLLQYGYDYYYLYAEWKNTEAEANARCGVAIMAQVFFRGDEELTNAIGRVRIGLPVETFDFVPLSLRAGRDYIEPDNNQDTIRPIVGIKFADESFIFSMHAISNGYKSKKQLKSLVRLLIENGTENFIIGGDFNHEPNVNSRNAVLPYNKEPNTYLVHSCVPTQGARNEVPRSELDYFIVRNQANFKTLAGTFRQDEADQGYVGELISDHKIVWALITFIQ